MKDIKLICIYQGPIGGDETSYNEYKIAEPTTVKELCEYIISDKGEWGYVGIKSKRCIFGDPCIEYAYGKYKTSLESVFSEEILDSYVELIGWSGGWSRGDWILTIKPKEKIKMEKEDALTYEELNKLCGKLRDEINDLTQLNNHLQTELKFYKSKVISIKKLLNMRYGKRNNKLNNKKV